MHKQLAALDDSKAGNEELRPESDGVRAATNARIGVLPECNRPPRLLGIDDDLPIPMR
jgi:hypothetical protein